MSERHDFVQEPDEIPRGAVYAGAAVYVGMVLAGIVAAWLLVAPPRVHVGLRPVTPVGPKEVSSVNQMFGTEKPPLGDVQAAQRAGLDEYSWVDGSGNVRIPIEQAMAIVAAQGIGAAPGGAGAGSGPRKD